MQHLATFVITLYGKEFFHKQKLKTRESVLNSQHSHATISKKSYYKQLCHNISSSIQLGQQHKASNVRFRRLHSTSTFNIAKTALKSSNPDNNALCICSHHTFVTLVIIELPMCPRRYCPTVSSTVSILSVSLSC